jgi:hypothetical protein
MVFSFVHIRQAGQFLPEVDNETVFVFPIVEKLKGVQQLI